MNFKKYILFILFSCSFVFSSQNYSSSLLSNADYITGEDGIIRMYINIVGNVKYPGTYLVYDGIDFLTAISVAGGYLQGSNLKKIDVYKQNGESYSINLDKLFDSGNAVSQWIDLKPHDTIYIHQKNLSKILTTSNLTYTILGLLNIAITLDKN